MADFFSGGFFQRLPNDRVAAGRRLTLVERLRANFTNVINAHQRAGVRFFVRGPSLGFGQRVPRRCMRAGRRGKKRA